VIVLILLFSAFVVPYMHLLAGVASTNRRTGETLNQEKQLKAIVLHTELYPTDRKSRPTALESLRTVFEGTRPMHFTYFYAHERISNGGNVHPSWQDLKAVAVRVSVLNN